MIIFWFRRDLSIDDNCALYYALKDGNKSVIPVFIFDADILNRLDINSDKRLLFIYEKLSEIDKRLEVYNSKILKFFAKPKEVFEYLTNTFKISDVYCNEDYEPYAIKRDTEIKILLNSKNIKFHSFKNQVIFAENDILKPDGKPYTVFTPYSKKWYSTLIQTNIKHFKSEELIYNFKESKNITIPEKFRFEYKPFDFLFPENKIDTSVISDYHKTRDYPSLNGTTKLGLHLRFGTLSIRKLVKIALETNRVFLNELIWREFYQMILFHFPYTQNSAFKKEFQFIKWRNSETDFEKWCKGETGYPIVDAGMRELNETGYMHNRVRMITSTFLTKFLLIDWKWGEQYFAQKLLDFELASNVGGWQWSASTGCDAVPYFRIFNPELQTQKFDKNFEYIKKWIPDFVNSELYRKPIVEYKLARERAIEVYKNTSINFKS